MMKVHTSRSKNVKIELRRWLSWQDTMSLDPQNPWKRLGAMVHAWSPRVRVKVEAGIGGSLLSE